MSAATASPGHAPIERPGHKRTKSATVIKNILTKGHNRTASETPDTPRHKKENSTPYTPFVATSMSVLPPDHPHAAQNILGERQHTNAQSPPKQSKFSKLGSHKRTKSSTSLRELMGREDSKNDVQANKTSSALIPTSGHNKQDKKGGKSKLTRASKFEEHIHLPLKDKENTTPPGSAGHSLRTPIRTQFTSQQLPELSTTTKVPLKGEHTVKDEIELYMPHDYSPSKGRNFNDIGRPTLGMKERPKSDGLIMSKSATSFMETLSRKKSNDPKKIKSPHDKKSENKTGSSENNIRGRVKNSAMLPPPSSPLNVPRPGPNKGSKVMAAVTMFDKKAKRAEAEAALDPKQIDTAFEAVLDARNIPEDMRQKMRSLKAAVKADFIKSHKAEIAAPRSKGSLQKDTCIYEQKHSSKPSTPTAEEMSAEDRRELESYVQAEGQKMETSGKRERPRSRTFTFSKGDSPLKKAKNDSSSNDKKSSSIPKSPSATALGKRTITSTLSNAPKSVLPEEYVSYLRRMKRPDQVEVGKLHKLRLLLRNETVSWVDNFIQLGGMTEIVDLLHRIMQTEWREEHEDNLLHEALLGLKGLCTTSLALQRLDEIADTFFPALLAMLFDPEHKGPSEFTTRSTIINLLFMHLNAATKDIKTLPQRAQKVLGYLQDPLPEAGKEPLPWIKDMHQSRPYTVWNREIVNVTKEVFWIFLHQLNVVPFPSQPHTQTQLASTATESDTTSDSPKPAALPGGPKQPPPETLSAQEYFTRFYPKPRAPHPAAPYVGGVEWDATHYISAHLDLLNGLVGAQASRAARNALRADLRASGLEKIMGATLRTCKEKFYAHVHDGLRTWVAAAAADAWSVADVRLGPKVEVPSPRKSPGKKLEKPPRLGDVPKLDLKVDLDGKGGANMWA